MPGLRITYSKGTSKHRRQMPTGTVSLAAVLLRRGIKLGGTGAAPSTASGLRRRGLFR